MRKHKFKELTQEEFEECLNESTPAGISDILGGKVYIQSGVFITKEGTTLDFESVLTRQQMIDGMKKFKKGRR